MILRRPILSAAGPAPSAPNSDPSKAELTTHPVRAGPMPSAGAANSKAPATTPSRSEEHTSELQSLMRITYVVFCLKTKNTGKITCIIQHKKYIDNKQHNN